MKIVNCEQRTAKWFAVRQNIPTGSSLANIVTPTGKAVTGQKRETYKNELLYQRITGTTIARFPTYAMERGNKLEPEAVEYFELEHIGSKVTPVGFCLHDDGFSGVSPDGFVTADEGLEIKTAMEAPYISKLVANKVPACNMVQIQACLWITGFMRWNFLLYDPELPCMEFVVERDDNVINALEIHVRAFCAELDDAEAVLRKRYGLPEREKINLDEYSADWRPF